MIKRIYLEITDACNLNCPFCTNEKGSSFMPLEKIDYITDEIKPICNYIYLHVLGEPLLHPDFNKILDLLDKKDFNLQLVTNGTLLYKYPDLLNHKCLRKLSISIHSINDLDIDDKYFKTIDYLIENNQGKSIELRFYDKKNLDTKINTYLQSLINKYSFDLSKKMNSYKLKDNVYVYFEEFFNWPNINDQIISNNGTCHGAKNQLAILHDGRVTICCLDPKGHNEIGNVYNQHLKDIINGRKYQDIIKNLGENKLICELCQKCSYRLRFSKQ